MPAPIKINFNEVTKANVGQLRLLNHTVLPVPYSDRFYEDLVRAWPRDNELVRLGYYAESLIGAVTAREELYDPAHPEVTQ